MQDLRARAQALVAASSAATRLVDVSCPVRQARSHATRVHALVVTDAAAYAVARSADGSTRYRVRVSYGASGRGWQCSCPDAGQRGMSIGPCKHAVAVARAIVDTTSAEIAAMAEVLTFRASTGA
jgi:uncharacterized Zn finger protein